MITYNTEGVCAKQITFSIDDNIVKKVVFHSGCDGNLQGISKLVEGMPVEEVIKRLSGIDCEGKGTSCPDQLAKALKMQLNNKV
ncbi:TIGR03905 family TSCPD domain-containing protein [Petroclostridium sp. X23]|uniref:TIGR03905 family TSCPD domain-containing protein n=1 Tax=Petroclostridium sp. X23 TaxID=3045146 RepID=UPI0024AE3811|nr:TIGR03905 family TSCPD domain-containing protein [Petroclostridium sp. X23]WHH61750.1 TIGR03905 family TSCPD domain-containing protein [Petroclostridium sp. X23]